jgi:hypothetical protein
MNRQTPIQPIEILLTGSEEYNPQVGFTHHPQAWIVRPGETVKKAA